MKSMNINKDKVMRNNININKITKKKKRGNFVNEIRNNIIRYFRNDSYLYSHLIASSLSTDYSMLYSLHTSGTDRNEPVFRTNDGKLKDRLVKYLKSDVYLYAPLEDARHRDEVSVKNVVSSPRAQEMPFARVTSTVSSRKVAWPAKQPTHYPVDKQGGLDKGSYRHVGIISPTTPVIPDGKKQTITCRNGRQLQGSRVLAAAQ